MKIKRNQSGFTILELLIATMVFSVILLLITYGLIQIGRTYYKGITLSKVQNASRRIMDVVTQDIQYSSGNFDVTTSPSNAFCISNHHYSFILDRQLTSTSGPVIIRENLVQAACAPSFPGGSSAEELMDEKMRLATFVICAYGMTPTADCPTPPTKENLYQVKIRVVYGDNDLLEAGHTQCKGATAGTHFCAVSELSTIVQRRLSK